MKPGDKVFYNGHNCDYIVSHRHPLLKKFWYVHGYSMALMESQLMLMESSKENPLNSNMSFPIIKWSDWMGIIFRSVEKQITQTPSLWVDLWNIAWNGEWNENKVQNILRDVYFTFEANPELPKQYILLDKNNSKFFWFVSGTNVMGFFTNEMEN